MFDAKDAFIISQHYATYSDTKPSRMVPRVMVVEGLVNVGYYSDCKTKHTSR